MESENGWRPATLPSDSDLLVWKTVPGTSPPVTLQVMRGLPEVFLPAWAADWNAYVEPLRDADSASYTPTNSVDTSNHLNGTAEDLDWDNHPFQVVGTVTDAQRTTIEDMVVFYEGWMFWAGDWDDPVDEMHSQMGYNTWNRNTSSLDFIARKIRSDGFSTFRRGALSSIDPPNMGDQPTAPTPVTPPSTPAPGTITPTDSATEVLYDAVPVIDMDRAAELVGPIMAGLKAAQCDRGNRQRRTAMYLAQTGHESDGYATLVEYGLGAGKPYFPYYGRGWIQLTWQSNYAKFGQWAVDEVLINDPDYFVNNPDAVATDQWSPWATAYFWLTGHGGHNMINDDADAGDITAVSETINGGDTGLQDRIDRYNQAIALGERLLLLTDDIEPDTGGIITMADVPQSEWDQMVADVKEIRAQLAGDWPQNGNDPGAAAALDKRKASGERLSVNDLLAWLKNHVSTHKAPTP